MSRSPPRSWYPHPDHKPPPDWYEWRDYNKERSPPHSYSMRNDPPKDPRIRHQESNQHSNNVHVDRPKSPDVHQLSRTRSLDQSWQKRPFSPNRESSFSHRDERLSGSRTHWTSSERSSRRSQSPPMRPLDSYKRSLSPRRDRFPSPPRDSRSYDRRAKSPPWAYGPHPPPHGFVRRSRSPPSHWHRQDHHFYEPPRRSPPRDNWRPPPAEWDRYHGPPPSHRHSPPPRELSPSESWDRRWSNRPISPSRSSVKYEKHSVPQERDYSARVSPTFSDADPRRNSQKYSGRSVDEKRVHEPHELPDYDPNVPAGQEYVTPVSGFFCKVCHKFYNSEVSAKINHCKSKSHYDKFSKWLSEVQVAELVQRSQKNCNGAEKANSDGANPAKQLKLDQQTHSSSGKTTTKKNSTSLQYSTLLDLSERVAKFMEKEKKNDRNISANNATRIKVEPTENGRDQSSDDSDSQVLITDHADENNTDSIEATLYNIRKLKVNELKTNLERRGMKSTGLKPLLRNRLEKVLMEEAEKHQQFRGDPKTNVG